MRTIYVIGWVGGFDWLYSKDMAMEILQSRMRVDRTRPVRYSVHMVPEILRGAEITAHLDRDPDSWQPPA